MYYYLTSAMKRRLILELKDSFARHPVYNKIVPWIQTKYAFSERPQFGIVLKGASANKVALAGDNFVGTVFSHVMLAYVGEPTYPLEWVREDLNRVRANHGQFPIQPGVYFLEILTVPTNANETGTFAIDPFLTITDEPLLQFISGVEHEAQLQEAPAKGTLYLWDNSRYLLREGVDYTCDKSGAVQFLATHNPGSTITASYRFTTPSIGPVPFHWNTADWTTLPGVVLAFGKRACVGDKVAIVVTQKREDTALAYGGKFEMSFDLDVIATDPLQMEEIADFAVMSLWSEKKPKLELEGIEIIDISLGGESEETYDETADIYYYMSSVSLQMRADWEVHVPLPLTISRVTASTPKGDAEAPPGQVGPSTILPVFNNLYCASTPIAVGRNHEFERIT